MGGGRRSCCGADRDRRSAAGMRTGRILQGVAERAQSTLWIPRMASPPSTRRSDLTVGAACPPTPPIRDSSATSPRSSPPLAATARSRTPSRRSRRGEMFRRVANAVGTDAASAYLSATNSCSHTDVRYSGAPAGAACAFSSRSSRILARVIIRAGCVPATPPGSASPDQRPSTRRHDPSASA